MPQQGPIQEPEHQQEENNSDEEEEIPMTIAHFLGRSDSI